MKWEVKKWDIRLKYLQRRRLWQIELSAAGVAEHIGSAGLFTVGPVGTARAMSACMHYQNLRDRTFTFALRVVQFCRALPSTWEARRIGGQLFDCGTAVGANYRAAGRARSDKEFISKLGVVIEEADESEFWLELLKGARITNGTERTALAKEASELCAIFVASRRTAQSNQKKKKADQKAARRIPSSPA